jgi:hypothetical protein
VRRALCILAALCVAWFAGAGAAHAQGGDARVSARLSAGVVKLGGTVTLTLSIEDTDRGRVAALPEVDGLRFGELRGPSYERGSSFVGGRITSHERLTWTAIVQPVEEGEFRIPEIVCEAPDGTFRSKPLALSVVADMRGEDLGFLTVETSSRSVVEGQPFDVEVVFGWDTAIQGKINYAHLSLPWWGELPGAIELEGLEPARDARLVQGISLNLGDEVTVEEIDPVVRGGKTFRALRLRRRFLPSRALTLDFPQGFLEFSSVRERGGFFDRRREKVESYFVSAPAFGVEVVPLPTAERPFDFGGAVGRIAATATVEPRDLFVGESLKLRVEWTGSANFEFFDVPDPERIDGFERFRSYGWTEEKASDRRIAVFDLAPLGDDVVEVPPLPLPVFDPEAGRYLAVETAPIPIRVRPLEHEAADLGDEATAFAHDIRDIDATPLTGVAPTGGSVPGDRALLGLGVALPLVWLATRTVVRRRRGDVDGPRERRRRRARRTLARELRGASSAGEQLTVLREFLGARTREAPYQWVGRRAALQPSLAAGPAAELDALVERLERAAYAGTAEGAQTVASAEVLAVADRLLGGGL